MNLSTAVFLINDTARAILAIYEKDEKDRKAPRTMFKTFDPTIKVDDYIVVPSGTRHGITTVKVVEVDVEVDFDSSTKVDWVIGKVEMADYEQIKAQEEAALEAIRSAEKAKKKRELREALFLDNAEKIKALPISQIGHSGEVA